MLACPRCHCPIDYTPAVCPRCKLTIADGKAIDPRRIRSSGSGSRTGSLILAILFGALGIAASVAWATRVPRTVGSLVIVVLLFVAAGNRFKTWLG